MTRHQQRKTRVWAIGWLLIALALLAGPFNRAGLWEPFELRYAELSRQLAHQLFGANVQTSPMEVFPTVSLERLGQGELPFTSAALGFKLLGLHDYAGRLPSLFWGVLAVIALWALLGRLSSSRARVFGALCLVTVPSFVWQSRMMLGDIATMGALSVATTGLALGCLDRSSGGVKFGWLLFGVLGLIAGQLCRGTLVGVAVPSMAVGIAGLLWALRGGEPGTKRWKGVTTPLLCLMVGAVTTGLGLLELWHAPRGFSWLLAAKPTLPVEGGSFGNELANLIHATFPWSALAPAAFAFAAAPSAGRSSVTSREAALGTTLLLVVLLSIAAMGALGLRNIRMPFPAVAALAGVIAISVTREGRDEGASKLVAASVVVLAVLTLLDFENIAEKLTLASGQSTAEVPAGFAEENRRWLRGALSLVLLACLLVLVGPRSSPAAPFSRARWREISAKLELLSQGHFLSGLVLLETTLITTGLLVHAHASGWIYVPFFAATLPTFGLLLRFAWAIPAVLVVVLPGGYLLVAECGAWLVARNRGALAETAAGVDWLGCCQARRRNRHGLRSLSVLSGGLMAAALLLTLGQGPRLCEQLSAKATLARYRNLATKGEDLALLGVSPQAALYYLGRSPRVFNDIGAAATWLSQGRDVRRFILFDATTLAELNAAFRSQSGGQNLLLPETEHEQGNVLLASQPIGTAETNHNPLRAVLPSATPKTAHEVVGRFGNDLEIVGWELVDAEGRRVTEAVPGGKYRLRFVFRVLDTPRLDWEIFVHLEGQGRRQTLDHEPASGNYPTVLWQSRDIIVDDEAIELDSAWRPGKLRLYLGFFRKTTRLEVTSGEHHDNRMIVGDVVVR